MINGLLSPTDYRRIADSLGTSNRAALAAVHRAEYERIKEALVDAETDTIPGLQAVARLHRDIHQTLTAGA